MSADCRDGDEVAGGVGDADLRVVLEGVNGWEEVLDADGVVSAPRGHRRGGGEGGGGGDGHRLVEALRLRVEVHQERGRAAQVQGRKGRRTLWKNTQNLFKDMDKNMNLE